MIYEKKNTFLNLPNNSIHTHVSHKSYIQTGTNDKAAANPHEAADHSLRTSDLVHRDRYYYIPTL